MFFNFFKKRPPEKINRVHTYVCKHCKFTCNDCKSVFCFSCYVHLGNPCPKCGKTNKDQVVKKEEIEVLDKK